MAGIQLTGLASGLDSEALIEQLMALRRQPRQRMELRERHYETRETALGDVATRLGNLKTAALDLASALAWGTTQSVESSDPARVAARRLGGAAPGGHTVEVLALARAEQHSFAYAASGTETSFQITQGATSTTFTLAANATIQQAADAINSTADSPVSAVVVNDGVEERLVLTSRKTGTGNGFTYTAGSAGLSGEVVSAGQNASYRLNGEAGVRESQSNTVTDAIPGVELTFKALTLGGAGAGVSVTEPRSDTAEVKERVKAFVEQYNSTVDFIRTKLEEDKVASPATLSDAAKGALRGDAGLTALLAQLRGAMFEDVSSVNPDALDQLSELGITTGGATGGAPSADSLAGKLVLDEAKLDAALASNALDVRRLLGGISGTDGFAQRIEDLIEPHTRAEGLIDQRQKEADSQAQRLRDSMARLDERLGLEEERLRRQFAGLESLLAQSQAQQSWLAGQLGALTGPQ
jgi:flagellar hook-associated protein 2